MSKIKLTIAHRMHDLFQGWDKAHGVFRPGTGKANARGKLSGAQSTDKSPVTVDLWKQHLAGEIGLGIYMLRLDSTVRFAAIDVDVYPLDPLPILKKIQEAHLPLTFCFSKSGGAHLYLFGKEDLPAALVRTRLSEWAALLGFPSIEIYPHKDELRNDNDFGKYLNMPYFKKERWAVDDNCQRLTVTEFIDRAEARKVTVKTLTDFSLPLDDDLLNGPPCLQALLANGPVDEFRDNTLVNLATYLRRRYPDEWQAKMEQYHRKYIAVPLSAREVVKIQKSVAKRDYNYMCHSAPIQALCSSTLCVTRQYGVRPQEDKDNGTAGFNLNLGQLVKYSTDPPTWEMEVNGDILRLTTDQLMGYPAFRKAVLEALDVLPILLTAKSWNSILDDKLSTLTKVAAPDEAGTSGQVYEKLCEYCIRRKGRSRDELKDGAAWWDDGVYFRAGPFLEYLQKSRITFKNGPRELAIMFRSWGYKHVYFKIKGAGFNCWCMPLFGVQTEADDVPRPGEVSV